MEAQQHVVTQHVPAQPMTTVHTWNGVALPPVSTASAASLDRSTPGSTHQSLMNHVVVASLGSMSGKRLMINRESTNSTEQQSRWQHQQQGCYAEASLLLFLVHTMQSLLTLQPRVPDNAPPRLGTATEAVPSTATVKIRVTLDTWVLTQLQDPPFTPPCCPTGQAIRAAKPNTMTNSTSTKIPQASLQSAKWVSVNGISTFSGMQAPTPTAA